MSGVTDLPFRKLALRFGAGLVVTEKVGRVRTCKLGKRGLDAERV